MFTFFIWGVRHDVPLDLTETLEMFFWQTFPQRHTRKILKNRDTTVLVCNVKYGRIVVWTHLCFFSTIFVQESVYGLCFWQHSCESSNKFNVNEILIHIHSDFDVFLLFDCVYLCDWIDGWLLFLIVLHIHDSQWMPSVFVLCLFVFVCVLCAYSGGGVLNEHPLWSTATQSTKEEADWAVCLIWPSAVQEENFIAQRSLYQSSNNVIEFHANIKFVLDVSLTIPRKKQK